MIIKAILPWPPSVNRYFGERVGFSPKLKRNIVFKFVGPQGTEYRKAVKRLFRSLNSPQINGMVEVRLAFIPPTKRKFDLDNMKKCLYDSLVDAGVIDDDSCVVQDISRKYPKDDRLPAGGVLVQIIPVDTLLTMTSEELDLLDNLNRELLFAT